VGCWFETRSWGMTRRIFWLFIVKSLVGTDSSCFGSIFGTAWTLGFTGIKTGKFLAGCVDKTTWTIINQIVQRWKITGFPCAHTLDILSVGMYLVSSMECLLISLWWYKMSVSVMRNIIFRYFHSYQIQTCTCMASMRDKLMRSPGYEESRLWGVQVMRSPGYDNKS